VQGVVKSYDPGTGDGVVIRDTDFAEFDLADGAPIHMWIPKPNAI